MKKKYNILYKYEAVKLDNENKQLVKIPVNYNDVRENMAKYNAASIESAALDGEYRQYISSDHVEDVKHSPDAKRYLDELLSNKLKADIIKSEAYKVVKYYEEHHNEYFTKAYTDVNGVGQSMKNLLLNLENYDLLGLNDVD